MIQYDDWSPASVFGSTCSPQQRSSKVNNHRVSLHGMKRSLSTSSCTMRATQAENDQGLREQSELIYQQQQQQQSPPLALLRRSKSVKSCQPSTNQLTSPRQLDSDLSRTSQSIETKMTSRTSHKNTKLSGEGLVPSIIDTPVAVDSVDTKRRSSLAKVAAVLLIQKHWRLFGLRRKEARTNKQVEHLRKAIQQIACEQIQMVWRRTRQYRRILSYLDQRLEFEARLHTVLAKATVNHRRLASLRRIQRWLVVHWITKRRQQQQQAVQCITRCIVKWRARREQTQQRLFRRAFAVLLGRLVLHQQKIRLFDKWLEETKSFVAQRDEIREYHAAKCVQRLFRRFVQEARCYKQELSAIKIQSLFRMVAAKQTLQQLYRQRQKLLAAKARHAAVVIQKVVRGFVVRARYRRLLERLKNRFQCANCGLIEPGGVYCKFCGRRRTTFGLLSSRIAPLECEIVDLTMMSPTTSASAAAPNIKQQPTARTRNRIQQAIFLANTNTTANANASAMQEAMVENDSQSTGSQLRIIASTVPPNAAVGHKQCSASTSNRRSSKLQKPKVFLAQAKLVTGSSSSRRDDTNDPSGLSVVGCGKSSNNNQVADIAEKTRARAAKLQLSEWEKEQRMQVNTLSLHLDRLRKAAIATKRVDTVESN